MSLSRLRPVPFESQAMTTLSTDLYLSCRAGDAIDREMVEKAEAMEARVSELEAERQSCHQQIEDAIRNCQRGADRLGMSAAGVQSIVASLKNALK